jgi:hypothetical protein
MKAAFEGGIADAISPVSDGSVGQNCSTELTPIEFATPHRGAKHQRTLLINEGIQGSRSAGFRFRLENSHPLLRAGRRRKCHLQTSIEGKFCSEYALGW